MSEYNQYSDIEDIGDRFGAYARGRGFSYYGFHLYTVWNEGDCPDVTLTNLSVVEQPGYMARLAPVLSPVRVGDYMDDGSFWWSQPGRDEAPVLVLPYRGIDDEKALLTLIPKDLGAEADDDIVKRGRHFYDLASRTLRERGLILPAPTLSPQETLCLTIQAEGAVTPAVLAKNGYTVEDYRSHLEDSIKKLNARNVLHAVVIALRLKLISPLI